MIRAHVQLEGMPPRQLERRRASSRRRGTRVGPCDTAIQPRLARLTLRQIIRLLKFGRIALPELGHLAVLSVKHTFSQLQQMAALVVRSVVGAAVARQRVRTAGGITLMHTIVSGQRASAGFTGLLAQPTALHQRLREWALRARLPEKQVRALADGDARWDRDEQRGSESSQGAIDGAGGVAQAVDPIHPHGLTVSVGMHGNVDVALRKLRRKVIVEGLMKKFKNNSVHNSSPHLPALASHGRRVLDVRASRYALARRLPDMFVCG